MWVKNVSKSLKNINSQKNTNYKSPQNFSTTRNEQYRESHIKHQIPNQHSHSHSQNQDQHTHNPNRGGFSGFGGRGRGSGNLGRGGYQGGNRFDRDEGNYPQNFSYQRK
jgi:hypothetical protein